MRYFGKSVVMTKNSIYYVDWDRRTVSGGHLMGEVTFTNGFCSQGSAMVLYLTNGRTLVTSTVIDIKQEENHDSKKQKSLLRLLCFRRA